MRLGSVAFSVAMAAAGLIAVSCGSAGVGVDACRQVESARCVWGPACGVNMGVPVRRSESTSPVDDCIRYYNDACLHGLVAAAEPSQANVDACVGAINAGDCAAVLRPQTNAACAWLTPAPAPDAAAPDAAATADAKSD
jgi:hypothetical protein